MGLCGLFDLAPRGHVHEDLLGAEVLHHGPVGVAEAVQPLDRCTGVEAGATIGELNAVRKHLSRFKGGLLARAADPATVVTLALSDVVGDPLDVIASGPTAPDSSTYGDALEVLEARGVLGAAPAAVVEHLTTRLGDRPVTAPGLVRRRAGPSEVTTPASPPTPSLPPPQTRAMTSPVCTAAGRSSTATSFRAAVRVALAPDRKRGRT